MTEIPQFTNRDHPIISKIRELLVKGTMVMLYDPYIPKYLLLDEDPEIRTKITYGYDDRAHTKKKGSGDIQMVHMHGTRYSIPRGIGPEIIDRVNINEDMFYILDDKEKETVLQGFTKMKKLYDMYAATSISLMKDMPHKSAY